MSEPTRPPTPCELLVYAPVGLAVEVRERLPRAVQAQRTQAEQRVQLYRFVGRLVVQQARAELRRRVERALEERRSPAVEVPVARHAEIGRTAPAAPVPATPPGETPPVLDDLPLADYDSLAANQVVARLAALGPDDLALVARYEAAHRRRRTILGKVAQLQGS